MEDNIVRKQRSKKDILFFVISVLIVLCLTACESDTDNTGETSISITEENRETAEKEVTENPSDKIVMPNGTSDYIGSEWTIETLTEHFKELGFENIRTVLANQTMIIMKLISVKWSSKLVCLVQILGKQKMNFRRMLKLQFITTNFHF